MCTKFQIRIVFRLTRRLRTTEQAPKPTHVQVNKRIHTRPSSHGFWKSHSAFVKWILLLYKESLYPTIAIVLKDNKLKTLRFYMFYYLLKLDFVLEVFIHISFIYVFLYMSELSLSFILDRFLAYHMFIFNRHLSLKLYNTH